ncbi:hypothetical protein TorRG33x02_009390, partial [Trema orientale]
CSVYIKDSNVSLLQSIAYIRLVDRNLAAQYELRIGTILGDRSNFELRLHLTLQPHIHIIDDVIAYQMPALGQLTARHSNRASRANPHGDSRGQRNARGS